MNANTSMTSAQAAVRNADRFRDQLAILDSAAVGVVLCRTREPHRAVETIRGLAAAKQVAFKTWNVLTGWETHNLANPDAEPQADGTKDANLALQMIGGVNGGTPFPDGFYAMFYPHFWLKTSAPTIPMVQAIKEYCRQFAESKRRLILVTPPGYTLPSELEEDVTILDFDAPSYSELSSIYDTLMRTFGSKAPNLSEDDRAKVIAAGAGMSRHEFETALSRAVVTHRTSLPNVDPDALVREVMKVKVEVVKRSEVLEVMSPDNIENIGGLDHLKDWLRKRSRCFGDSAKQFGIEAPKGIALIGPPGTGKSLCAKATAALLGLPLIRFDVSRVFQSLVGQSEERVRAALKMLDAMAPCVAMLDEVDKAFQTGSGGDSGVSQRVLGLILTHMQESDAPIFWVASANRVNNLPSEFLRRGRLDEVFSVSVPDVTERLEILKIHLRKRGTDPEQIADLQVAADRSEGYVPAEIEAAVKDALIEAFTEGVPITGQLIADQLGNMKPLSVAFADQFAQMQEWAEQNARPASRSTVARNAARVVAAPRPRGARATSLDS